MVHSTAEDCMLHLTTRIDNIDFGNDLNIYSNNQFSVSNGDITMEIGYHPHEHEEGHEEGHENHHGEYHVMFTSNGHVLSDFHGVTGKHIALDVLNHSLQASFVVNLMEPFSEFLQQGSNFSLNLHPLNVCYDKVISGVDTTVTSSPEGSVVTSSPEGAAVTSSPEGAAVTSSPEGSVVTSSPEGAAVTSSPEGSVVTSSPEGAAVTSSPEGSVVTSSPEGAAVTSSPEGAAVTSSPEVAKGFTFGGRSGERVFTGI
ncbi:TRP47 family tandem repeat effector [Ehrlichia ruminantium]|uniref:TRP47 family tandem repeat effector n=1 Tax=Ehrlichia ruminantium TaxID=779 RepID=UPI0021554ACF|nr:TRP47 family tandem repeat effector [Ehrlichia ruminantium]